MELCGNILPTGTLGGVAYRDESSETTTGRLLGVLRKGSQNAPFIVLRSRSKVDFTSMYY